METNSLSINAMGGTELMLHRLHNHFGDRLDDFQIIPTRVTSLNPDKIRILWIHDLCDDPSVQHLANGGWQKFHHLVFVSYHQMNSFIKKFQIPFSVCTVIENGIELIDISSDQIVKKFERPEIKLIYTSTPHRGLDILLHAFNAIKYTKKYPHVSLDIFSSFKLYGWEERDREYEALFKMARESEGVTYHGTQPNQVVRDYLKDANLFVYPSTWEETSCLCLIEAMSAGCIPIHSSLGALPETAKGVTLMYPYTEDKEAHLHDFAMILEVILNKYIEKRVYVSNLALYCNFTASQMYGWELISKKWDTLLTGLRN